MITPDHPQLMARYNRWQNESLIAAADGLTDEERRADGGAFFKSIHGTLCHILWADRIWMHRLAGWEKPEESGIAASMGEGRTWSEYQTLRRKVDQRLIDWADALTDADLSGTLTWYSGATGAEKTKPKWLLVTHLFNHQTHHRGQVHALLTRMGARPADTDIPFMPNEFNAEEKSA